MCDLCSPDPEVRKNARAFQSIIADKLRLLASQIDRVARGEEKPHSPYAKMIGLTTVQVIRYLAQEWL